MQNSPFTFASPTTAWIACAICAAIVIVAILRRPAVPRMTKVLVLLGLVCLSLGAGGLVWRRPAQGEVAVMVDLSPSTRTAEFRDRAMLDMRIGRLLGSVPYRVYYFADGAGVANPFGTALPAHLPDLPAERTRYEPPPASAVLLFSDGRFPLPSAAACGAPTYPVIDIGLEGPPDAAVVGLETGDREAVTRIRNSGGDRELSLSGISGTSPTTAPAGEYVVVRPIDPSASAGPVPAATVSAQLNPGDPFPENDRLETTLPPPRRAEKWLIDATGVNARPGWRVLPPEALPVEPAAYLAPSVIVLNDCPADRLSLTQQDRLSQYVRDLGGALVILGGDHAFAAGGYPGSTLESLSPLSSTPPRPTTRWILLADSSGSMNSAAAGPVSSSSSGTGASGAASLWHYASEAIVKLLPRLPPDDRVSVGNFAEDITWWSMDRSVRETAALPLPPANVFPHGPTNLRPALDAVIRQADAGIPNELFLLTDADADVGDPGPLIDAMKAKHLRLFLLALGEGRGLNALRQIVEATDGRLLRQDDAGKWAQGVEELLRSAAPKRVETRPLSVRFTGGLADEPGRAVSTWNRTWLKAEAAGLAEAEDSGERVVPAGQWNLGAGRTVALGFALNADSLERVAKFADRPPRDPRYRVSWKTGTALSVLVNAASLSSPDTPGAYLNGRRLLLDLSPQVVGGTGGTGQTHLIPQSGPGRYELTLPAPRAPSIATLRDDDGSSHVIDRIAVAGRYAPEFDTLGNDLNDLRTLADRTGGALIPPQQVTPIDFRWPQRDEPIGSYLAALGAIFIAMGLIWWRAA